MTRHEENRNVVALGLVVLQTCKAYHNMLSVDPHGCWNYKAKVEPCECTYEGTCYPIYHLHSINKDISDGYSTAMGCEVEAGRGGGGGGNNQAWDKMPIILRSRSCLLHTGLP